VVSVEPHSVERPQILRYKDYRQFLRDFYNFKKSLRAGFSFRRFSQLAGINSPNYLQLVMQGKRNLSEKMAMQVVNTLGLLGPEKQYFIALVAHVNAKTEDSRIQAQSEILRSIKNLVAKEIPKAKVIILTEWYHLIVREMVLLPEFEPSGEWIAQKLRGLIRKEDAEKSLNFLLQAGFLEVRGGRFMQADPILDTGNAFDEVIGLKYHVGTLEAWAKSMPLMDKSLREFGVLNIPIANDKITELKERMRKFQDELIGWLQDEQRPERVVQLGLYLVPITK
jgi:uncharacterized protein (TIGR02147 family)